MKILENLPVSWRIKIKGNEKEKELFKSGKDIRKLLARLSPGEKYKPGWDLFDKMKKDFNEKLNEYNGNFSDYFSYTLNRINEEERQALGYHLSYN